MAGDVLPVTVNGDRVIPQIADVSKRLDLETAVKRMHARPVREPIDTPERNLLYGCDHCFTHECRNKPSDFPPGRGGRWERPEPMDRLLFTVSMEKEMSCSGEDVYVALCVELDIACQGPSPEEANARLREAVERYLETAAPSELERRLPHRAACSEACAAQPDLPVNDDLETMSGLILA